mgnify:CR=1 FL=1
MGALAAYPGGMQIGGGITAENVKEYLDAGASHVIVTSYVFQDGIFHEERLQKLVNAVGKEHVVLDLSCRRKDGKFYVVTDRWQKFTELALSHEVLDQLSEYCDEFLIHGVDVEGKGAGMETELVRMLGSWEESQSHMPVESDHWKIWKDSEKRVAERSILQLEVLLICLEEIPYAEVCKSAEC